MNNVIRTALLASLIAGLSLPAIAQTTETPPALGDQDPGQGMGRGHGPGRDRDEWRGHGGRVGHMMRIIDANGDGVIGDDEAASLAELGFARLDKDGNGSISEDEFTTIPGRHWWSSLTGRASAMTDGLKARFAKLDANKDGKVDKSEFMTDAKTRFAAADTDKDGKVSPWEFRSQPN